MGGRWAGTRGRAVSFFDERSGVRMEETGGYEVVRATRGVWKDEKAVMREAKRRGWAQREREELSGRSSWAAFRDGAREHVRGQPLSEEKLHPGQGRQREE
jgi:hypothetical protein